MTAQHVTQSAGGYLERFLAGVVTRKQVVVVLAQQPVPVLKVAVELAQEQLCLLLIAQVDPFAEPGLQPAVLRLHPVLKVHGGL